MINSIKISSLRNNELLQFFTDVVERCNRFDTTELKINSAVKSLQDTMGKLNNAYNKEKGSDVTQQLMQIDAMRDNDIVGIQTVCEGYEYHRDSTISEAAGLVNSSIDRHGKSIARLNYKAETTVLNAILKDWDEDAGLKAALKTLNLAKWVADLKAENKKFSDTYQDRVDDQMESAGISFSELRADGINAYKALCDTIFAFSIIEKQVDYTQLIEAINLIIADYKALLERRNSTKEAEPEA